MKKIILIFIIFVYCLSEFVGDKLIKKIIETNISNSFDRDTKIEKLKIDYIKGQASAKNIKLYNKNFSKYLLTIENVYVKLDTVSIFSNNVNIDNVIIEGLNLNYFFKLKILDLNDYSNVEDNVKSLDKTIIEDNSKSKSTKQFNIKKLVVKKVKLSINNEELKINDRISLKDMEFENVGNTQYSNNYKKITQAVLKKIIEKVKIKILTGKLTNELKLLEENHKDQLKEKIKDKLRNKLKDLLN